MQELLALALHHLRDGNARCATDDFGDFLGTHGGSEKLRLGRIARFGLLGLLQAFLKLGQNGVLKLGELFVLGRAAVLLHLVTRAVDLVADALGAERLALLLLPDLLKVGILAGELVDLVLNRLQTLLRGVVGLLLHGLALDLELDQAAVKLVESLGLGIDLHLHAGRGLVDQIDGLVGQEAVGDVAVRKFGRGHDGWVGDLDAMMRLIAFLQAAQNGDRVLDARFVDQHLLEAALEGGILLDVLAVLVKSGRADHVQLAARERGLEHVARIHRAFRLAGAHHGVQLVDEEDDPAGLGRHFLQKLLETLLELAAVLRTRNQARHVERENALAAKAVGHLVVDDALRQTLDHGRLAHAGLADQDGVVLAPALQDLHRAADLVVTTDHGIKLALTGALGQVDRVFLERLALAFRIGVVGLVAAADGFDRRFNGSASQPCILRKTARLAPVLREGEKQHFRRDELVAALHRLLLREVEEVHEVARDLHVAARARNLRQALDGRVHFARQALDVHARTFKKAPARTFTVGEHSRQNVHRLDDLAVMSKRERLGLTQRFLEFSR